MIRIVRVEMWGFKKLKEDEIRRLLEPFLPEHRVMISVMKTRSVGHDGYSYPFIRIYGEAQDKKAEKAFNVLKGIGYTVEAIAVQNCSPGWKGREE